MRTADLLRKMPKAVVNKLEYFRSQYGRYEAGNPYREVVRVSASNYCQGLKDAGLINERERQTLFVYTTIERRTKIA